MEIGASAEAERKIFGKKQEKKEKDRDREVLSPYYELKERGNMSWDLKLEITTIDFMENKTKEPIEK